MPEKVQCSYEIDRNLMNYYGTPQLSYVVIYHVSMSNGHAIMSNRRVIMSNWHGIMSNRRVIMSNLHGIMSNRHVIMSNRRVIMSN